MFGPLLMAYFKFESSGRGGMHGHGQCLSPVLQAKNLQKIFEQHHDMQEHLFQFMESFSSTYLPHPVGNVKISNGEWFIII